MRHLLRGSRMRALVRCIATWLRAYPWTLVAWATGVITGLLIALPFGWVLPEPIGALAGAGIGAAAAVGGAVWAAKYKQDAEAAQDRAMQLRRAQRIAIESSEVLLRLRSRALDVRSLLKAGAEGRYNGMPVAFVSNAMLYGADELPHGDVLDDLPYPIGPSIAALRAMLAMYNGSVQRFLAKADALPERLASLKLPEMLDASQAAMARAAKHLSTYEPSFSFVDYLDRGDGTSVPELQDYGDEA